MIIFDESEKTGLSGFRFQTIRFWQFQDKTNKGAKFKDLKIQGILRHGKRLKSVKKLRCQKSKPKVAAAKTGLSNFGFQNSGFPRTDIV
jgi:hypothetical protein